MITFESRAVAHRQLEKSALLLEPSAQEKQKSLDAGEYVFAAQGTHTPGGDRSKPARQVNDA